MPRTVPLYKRGRRRKQRRTVAAPTEGYIVEGMLFKSLYEIWDQFGWEWDDRRTR